MLKQTRKWAALLASPLLALPAAAEVAFCEAVRDNTLIESSNGALSNGAGPSLFAGRTGQSADSIRRGLIAFDIAAAIPRGARILSAELELSVGVSRDLPVELTLQRMSSDWGEGTSSSGGGVGAPSTPGDASWIHTFFATEFWAAPGGDFAELPSASAEVGAPGVYVWGSTEEMVADVQQWLDEPSANHGWAVLGDESARRTVKRLWSREVPDFALAPRLVVEFFVSCLDEGLQGGPLGLCHAYCEVLACDSADPRASARACQRLARNFARRGAGLLPCSASGR